MRVPWCWRTREFYNGVRITNHFGGCTHDRNKILLKEETGEGNKTAAKTDCQTLTWICGDCRALTLCIDAVGESWGRTPVDRSAEFTTVIY